MGKERNSANRPQPSPILSAAQRDIWFDQQRLAETASYNIGGYLEIKGPLNRARFSQALSLLIEENDALRLRLEKDGPVPRWRLSDTKDKAPAFSFTDISSEDRPDRRADQLCQQALDRPFQLDGGSLFRSQLLKLSDQHYRWINVYHHLICDGWGTGLVLRRLSELYQALSVRQRQESQNPLGFLGPASGSPNAPALSDPHPSFFSYLLDQDEKQSVEDSRQAARQSAKQAYWKDRFSDPPPPLFQPVKAAEKPLSASLQTALAREDFDRITQVAGQNSASPLHFFLTALYLYFVRTQNLEALVVGLPLRNRTGKKEKETVGLFTTVAALPLSLDLAQPTSDLMGQVAREVKQSYRHLPVSLAEVIRQSGALAQGRNRLFDIALSFELQDYPLSFDSAPAEAVAITNQDQQTPLSLFVREYHDEQDITLEFAYRRDIFEEDQIRIIARDLTFLLKDIAANPEVSGQSRTLLPPQVYRQLTEHWPRESSHSQRPPLAAQRILKLAAEKPGTPALVWEDHLVSYGELAKSAGKLAAALKQEGLATEDRIAVALPRGLDLVITQLAVLMTGAAFVPLDPGHPRQRRLTIVQQGELAGYLSDQAEALPLPDTVRALTLDDLKQKAEALPPLGLEDLSDIKETQAAYVIFTSGSTGQPKGVVIEQAGLANLIAGQIPAFHLSANARVLQFATPAFDAAVSEVFVTLGAGAQLVLAAPEQLLPGAALKSLITRQDVTHVTLPPSALALMDPQDYRSLKVVISAGEPCPPQVAQRWKDSPEGAALHFINAYGPTEVSVCATTFEVATTGATTEQRPAATLPIGRPMPDVYTYVLDDNLSPMPEGVIGELCVGGVGVAREYLNQPERSRDSFQPNPFRPGERLYRTGDLARWRNDGVLEFIERRDQQIKLRGFRIEPGEVEACLDSHPAIEQSLVLAKDQTLLAYLVTSENSAASEQVLTEELRARAAQVLPAYMVPAHFTLLESFPLTPSGKIDRDALPPPQRRVSSGSGRAARSGEEELVSAVFAEVLGLDKLDPEADFFVLGGHSLLAAQAANRLSELWGEDFPLQLIFENPTAAGLALVLATRQSTPLSGTARPIATTSQITSADGLFPLSHQQERLWFLDQLGGKGIQQAYLVPLLLDISGPLDKAALEGALAQVIEQQEVLRSRIMDSDQGPQQVVDPVGNLPFSHKDLSDLNQQDQEEVIETAAHQPFDLQKDWPVRLTLFQRSEENWSLLILLHHIACDGWSIGVLAEGLSREYRRIVTQTAETAPALSLTYRDYCSWQRDALADKQVQKDLTYWTEQLADLPASLNLPFDKARPALQSYEGGLCTLSFSPDELVDLQQLGRQRGCTLFMTLAGLFSLLLQRLGAGDDIPLGTPTAGRGMTALEPLIGLFVNSLVLRLRPTDDLTFLDLLEQTRHSALAAYQHADCPFEQVVEALQPDRSLAHAPLFQVLFTLDSHSQGALEKSLTFPGLSCSQRLLKSRSAKLDLSLYLEEASNDSGQKILTGAFEYNSDLFSHQGIERLISQFKQLISSVLQAPEAPLNSHSLLTGPEQARLLTETAVGAPLLASGQSVLQEIWAQADLSGTATAVMWPHGENLSYQDLQNAAERLSQSLIRQGIGPEDIVALALPRSPLVLIAMLAVWRSGAAFLPLDPGHPEARRRLILQDAMPRLILCDDTTGQDPLHQRYNHLTLSLTEVLAQTADPSASQRQTAPPWPDAGSAAYLLYTSGSTGKPKGVLVEQASFTAFHQAMEQALGAVTPNDTLAAITIVTFDISLFELFAPLRKGAALLLVPEDISKDGLALARLLDDQAATLLQATPSSYRLLQSAEWTAPHRPTLYCGGEALQPDLARQLQAWGSKAVNLYGPTEATIWSSYCDFTNLDLSTDAPLPLGRPLPGWSCFVLDDRKAPQPEGVSGELFIAGPGLARGYHNAPDKTAAAFDTAPFQQNLRLYATGDLATWQQDGQLAFLGRKDHQIKLRGFRIEPGEIEENLLSHPDVKEALVVKQDDSLAAYLIPSAAAGGSLPQLRQDLKNRLARRLPEYMRPNSLVFLEDFPLNPAGKIDRKRLPAAEIPQQAEDKDTAAPASSGRQQLICALFAEVLGLTAVSPDASFFDLGGQSLLAAQVVARLSKTLQQDVPLRLLFEAPTARGLEIALDGLGSSSRHKPVLQADPDKTTGPLTFQQERLWFLDNMNGDSDAPAPKGPDDRNRADSDKARLAYLMPVSLRLRGALDAAALQTALSALVARQPVLRTLIVQINGEICQKVDPAADQPLPLLSLAGLSEDEETRTIRGLAFQPFDLTQEWPLRACLLKRSDQDWTLLLTLHHLAADGWSLRWLHNNLPAAYQAALAPAQTSAGSKPGSSAVPVSYLDYARWQRQAQARGLFEPSLTYWKEKLSGLPELLDLPLDRPRAALQSYDGGACPFTIETETLVGLKALSKQAGTTLFMTLAAAFSLLLKRLGGGDDMALGTALAGRNHSELDELVGLFVNTLILRLQPQSHLTFSEFLKQVKTTALEAYGQGDVPFEQVVEALRPERSLSHNPLFQVMFALDEADSGPRQLTADLSLQEEHLESPTAKMDLSLHLREVTAPDEPAVLLGMMEYNSQIFDRQSVEGFCRLFSQLLAEVLENPDRTLADLPLLSPDQHQRLTEDWASGPDLPASPRPVILDIARAARNQPQELALLSEQESWSYARLWQAVEQLAKQIKAHGVESEDKVVLALPRRPLAIVALLAVWRAGACLLPLDPKQPAERRRLILEDAAPKLILTEKLNLTEPGACEDGLFQGYPCLDVTLTEPDAETSPLPTDPEEPPHGWRNNAAYLLYTSGSTGKPKGVTIEQGALADHQAGLEQVIALAPGDRTLETASLAFDTALDQILLPLRAGAGLVFLEDQAWTARELKRLSREFSITWLDLPTAYWRGLVSSWVEQPHLIPDSKLISLGGEAIRATDLDHWQQLAPAVRPRLINAYGPTEATVTATAREITDDNSHSHPFGASIGRPLAGRRCYVLDDNLQPVPVGVVGELCLGGIGLAREYHQRADLSAKSFPSDPYVKGARLYRTGDQARWRADGSIEFLGRRDHQIKLRGFRIEPGEIEACLTSHPDIEQALVLLRQEQLVAYLVPTSGCTNDGDALVPHLQQQLKQQLPDYMQPSHLLVLPAFALTPSGKIDRKALPSPTQQDTASVGQAPQNPLEQVLAELYETLLEQKQLTRTAHFFELGGHSLLALQMAARLSDHLGREIAPRRLFETPRICDLAESLAADNNGDSGVQEPASPALTPVAQQSPAPLSFQQERLWFLDRLGGEDAAQAYLIPLALKLTGQLDREALSKALDHLVRNQPQLRSRFLSQKGNPYLVTDALEDNTTSGRPADGSGPAVSGLLTERDLREVPRPLQQKHLAKAALRPFDLTKDWPIRAQLFQLSDSSWALIITLHHLVADGWSSGEIAEEISQAYKALLSGRESARSPAAISYVDYIHWQRNRRKAGVFDRELDFWERELAGSPTLLPLPLDHARPRQPSYRGAIHPLTFSGPQLAALNALSAENDCSLFMTMTASFAALLNHLGGGSDLPIGTVVAGRKDPALTSLVGLFVNTVVLRLTPKAGQSFTEFLSDVRTRALAAFEHDEVPFDQVVERLSPPRNLSANPLFQVMFTLDNHTPQLDSQRLDLPNLDVSRLELAPPIAKVDLSLFLEERENEQGQRELSGGFEYNSDLFEAETLNQMARTYESLVQQIVSSPDLPLFLAETLNKGSEAASESASTVLPGMSVSPGPESKGSEAETGDSSLLPSLLDIWQSILPPQAGNSALSSASNFFECGGHSLMAVQLAERLETWLQRPVPLSLVFEHPSARHLARALDQLPQESPPSNDPWLTVNSGGDGAPLICLPPATGYGLWAYGVSRHFSQARPVLSLQSNGLLSGSPDPEESLEELAERCLQQLQDKGILGSPSDRIALAGWSFGGHLAYALGQKLKASRGQVGSLIIIDAMAQTKDTASESPSPAPHRDSELFRALLSTDLPLDPASWHKATEEARLTLLLDLARGHPNLPPTLDLPGLQRMLSVTRKNSNALAAFHPDHWSGDLHLVRAKEEADGPALLHWDQLAQGAVHLHWVPGNHGSLVQGNNARHLAQIIETLLQ
ncbi:amino acid adenylation domain-containing protein [Rhodovibrionaceae bacterium A322]